MFLRSLKNGLAALLVGLAATSPAEAGKISSYSSGAPLQSTDQTLFARGTANVTGTPEDIATYIKDKNNVFQTPNTTCNADVSSALQAHLETHNGVALLPAGCYYVGAGLVKTTTPTQMVIRPFGGGKVTLKHDGGSTSSAAITVNNTAAATNAVDVSSISTVTPVHSPSSSDYVSQISVSALPTGIARGSYCAIYSDDMGIGQGTNAITSITKANPAVVTLKGAVSTSDQANNDVVRIQYVQGMTQLNSNGSNNTYVLANRAVAATSVSFNLYRGAAISGATKAAPGVISLRGIVPTTTLDNGSYVTITGVSGMSQLNSKNYLLANRATTSTTTTFNLVPINTLVSITNATTAHVVVNGTGLVSNGDTLTFTGVGGMTELNGNSYRVANKTTVSGTTEFDLKTADNASFVNSTGYGTFTSGGYATGPTLDTSSYSTYSSGGVIYVPTLVDSSGFGTYTTGGYLGSSVGFMGEMFQVMETDASPAAIRTYGKLVWGSYLTTNAHVRCLDSNYRVDLSGLTIEPYGTSDTDTVTKRPPAIKLMGLVSPKVSDITCNASWAQCLDVYATAGGIFDRLEGHLGINNPSRSQYTYLGRTYAMNYDNVWRDLIQWNGRHAFTTDGYSGADVTTSWYNRGAPKNIAVENLTCHNVDGTCGDTHPEGAHVTFNTVSCFDSQQGSTTVSGTIKGACVQDRALFTTMQNIVASGGSRGISITQIDHGMTNNTLINGLSVRGTTSPLLVTGTAPNQVGQWTDYGIEVDSEVFSNYPNYIRMNNVTAENVGTLFYLNIGSHVFANNVMAHGIDEVGRLEGGALLEIGGTQSYDYRNNPRDTMLDTTGAYTDPYHNLFYMRGDASYGGAHVKLYTAPTIVKGDAADKPRCVFKEHSTTGSPKTYYLPAINESNASAVTATATECSGATTFQKDTSVASPLSAVTTSGDITTSGGNITATTGKVQAGQICNAAGTACFDPSSLTITSPISDIILAGRTDSNLTWTAMPSAETFVNNSSRHVTRFDLTNFYQCRLIGNVQNAGATGSKLIARYAAVGTGPTVGNYTANLGTTELSLPLTSTGTVTSGWVDLAAGAKNDNQLALVGSGGDGSTTPQFGILRLQCK